MKKAVLDWLNANRSIAIQCLVVFGLSVIVTSIALRPKSKVSSTGEGYDFNSRRVKEFSGPTIGETLDVRAMQTEDGRSLSEVAADSSFYMIAVVDPHCDACKAAQSQMNGISEGLKKRGIPYFFVMLSNQDSKAQYFAYVNSISQESKGLIWRTGPLTSTALIPGRNGSSYTSPLESGWNGVRQMARYTSRSRNASADGQSGTLGLDQHHSH